MSTTLTAASIPIPSALTPSTMSTLRLLHTEPWLRPSNVTVPIITHTNSTVPGSGSSDGRPPSGGRTPTTRSRVSNGLMRANRPK